MEDGEGRLYIIRNNRGGEYGQVLLKHAWERHNGTPLHS